MDQIREKIVVVDGIIISVIKTESHSNIYIHLVNMNINLHLECQFSLYTVKGDSIRTTIEILSDDRGRCLTPPEMISGSKLMLPSKEQCQIIEASVEGYNIIVDSVAGSGKTTSILHICRANPDKQIKILTYNSELRKDTCLKLKTLGDDIFDAECVECNTYHSLAYKYFKTPGQSTDVNVNKVVTNNIKYPTELIIDILIIDESQDVNPLYFSLIKKYIIDSKRLSGKDIQIIVIGDTRQMINEYNNSDERYLTLADRLYSPFSSMEWIRLNLTVSYRLTHEIAEFINVGVLGSDRIKTVKSGDPVTYIQIDLSELTRITNLIGTIIKDGGYDPSDVYIISPTIKKYPFVRKLVNRLSEVHPIYFPDSDDKTTKSSKGKICVSSFSSSKGTERKLVILLGMNMRLLSKWFGAGGCSECPNILYVALTRAIEKLVIIGDPFTEIPYFINTKWINSNCKMYGNWVRNEGMSLSLNESVLLRRNEDMRPRLSVINITVSELAKHCSFEITNRAVSQMKVVRYPREGVKIRLPSHIFSKIDGSTEDVAIINGTVIPIFSMKHVKTGGQIFDRVWRNRKEHIPEHLLVGVERIITSFTPGGDNVLISDLCLIVACDQAIIGTGKSRLMQIPDFNWLNTHIDELSLCTERINHHFKEITYVEKEVEKMYIFDGVVVVVKGCIDIIDSSFIGEIKCVSELSDEHLIQLAFYLDMVGKEHGKLLNILDGEYITVESDGLEDILKLFIYERYIRKSLLKTDEQFVLENE
jgi:hypothetical protein